MNPKNTAMDCVSKMIATDFDFQRVAQGYQKRPFLHKQVIERFQRDVTYQTFTNGLDVGCGAGLSAKALKMICAHVTGTDISKEMIAVAKEVYSHAGEYDFIVSSAEQLPAFPQKFDIVTAAGVVQWVEKDLFLTNLTNLVDEGGYVLIYDFAISDQMRDCSSYTRWFLDMYLKEFPKPFRDESVWTNEDAARHGFVMLGQPQYEMEYDFDEDSFIEFMMIQSNVNAKIEGEHRDTETVREWFRQSVAPLFRGTNRTLMFKGYSWYLRRV